MKDDGEGCVGRRRYPFVFKLLDFRSWMDRMVCYVHSIWRVILGSEVENRWSNYQELYYKLNHLDIVLLPVLANILDSTHPPTTYTSPP